MSPRSRRTCSFALFALSAAAGATQFDIHGPAGSVAFGNTVTVLANGNFVVTDPDGGPVATAGAVHLFSASGTRIATLSGRVAGDWIGSGGITALANGNFVVSSPCWHNGSAAGASAVTWVDGRAGVDGSVSEQNSLVGARAGVRYCSGIGYDASNVVALADGDYAVVNPDWYDDDAAVSAGAVTWGSGAVGTSGTISSAHSLVGTHAGDAVGSGGIVALGNGSFVVASPNWNDGTLQHAGAVTFVGGPSAFAGAVSEANSLVGSTADDQVGIYGVVALGNGNYTIASPFWDRDAIIDAGAVTWGGGAHGVTGRISAANSLVGSTAADKVGEGGVTVLTNGNYVVSTFRWHHGSASNAGAVTWADGRTGAHGEITTANSLYGAENDGVGEGSALALANGNYVVRSFAWSSGGKQYAGAVTWGNGRVGTTGQVSAANSLVGSADNEWVGTGMIVALSNGNYVVAAPLWNDATGAVVWGNGATGIHGEVSPDRALTGSSPGDFVGGGYMIALTNGNYAVASPGWKNGSIEQAGAVTWGDGSSGITGPVSTMNSLVGTHAGDRVGSQQVDNSHFGLTPLPNGSYVVSSGEWNGSSSRGGASTWCDGTRATSAAVSSSNSLVGTYPRDNLGAWSATVYAGSNTFVIPDFGWNFGDGAIVLARGTAPLSGYVGSDRAVLGNAVDQGVLSYAYDTAHDRLIVGRRNSNLVTVFELDDASAGMPKRGHSKHRRP